MSRKSRSLVVKGTVVTVATKNEHDYISLTDMLRAKDGEFFIADWLRNRNTVEFLGVWERVHNPKFNYGEFSTIRSQAGLNSYRFSVKEMVVPTCEVTSPITSLRPKLMGDARTSKQPADLWSNTDTFLALPRIQAVPKELGESEFEKVLENFLAKVRKRLVACAEEAVL